VLEAAVSALLGPDALTRRAADLRLKVLPKAKSYVTTYRVVEEGETEVGIFDVHVSAEIAADRLVRDLADRPKDPRLPAPPVAGGRAVVCVASDPGASALPRLDAALRAMLGARGLEPVPTAGCADDEVVRVMRSSGARCALVGEVVGGSPAPIRGTALVGREGKLMLRLLEPDGRRAATGQGEGAGFGATLALANDDLAAHALAQAGSAIEEALGALGGGTRGVVPARVMGVRRMAQLTRIRGALERISGVESVELRRFSPGVIELDIHTRQSVAAIAAAAARVGATYGMRASEDGSAVAIEALEPAEPPAEAPTP
jgi:hypothetical protein